ncbi:MAG: ABC transporter ATP-binding protein [Acidimicrobiales bacterium]
MRSHQSRADEARSASVAGIDVERRESAYTAAPGVAGARAAGEPVVLASGLTKRFGSFTAVDGITFAIAKGASFGFLGPNGAGKTSTMRMVSCLSPITEGSLRVLGMDPAAQGTAIRSRLGLCPQEDTLDLELTVRDNLYLYGRYFDIPKKIVRERVEELLDFAQLTERGDDEVDKLSGGMKRRLTIARALVSDPELVILDEPTTGLDPQARHLLWDRLYRLKQQGVTLIITTHYMDEAEQRCDRLVVMDGGRIAAEGSPQSLISDYSSREVVELRFTSDENEAAGQGLADYAPRVETLPDRVLLYADDGDATMQAVHAAGWKPETALVRRSSLEDVFLRLTGRSLVD